VPESPEKSSNDLPITVPIEGVAQARAWPLPAEIIMAPFQTVPVTRVGTRPVNATAITWSPDCVEFIK
jgi:hypothetical protein